MITVLACHPAIFLEPLDAFGSETLINIELKGQRKKDSKLAEKVCEIVNKMTFGERVWFSSFDVYLLEQTRKYSPGVPNGFLFTNRSTTPNKNLGPSLIEAVHPYFRVIGKKYVSRMHNDGLRVAVWTVDKLKVAGKCFEANVDVIISNDPGKLINGLC